MGGEVMLVLFGEELECAFVFEGVVGSDGSLRKTINGHCFWSGLIVVRLCGHRHYITPHSRFVSALPQSSFYISLTSFPTNMTFDSVRQFKNKMIYKLANLANLTFL